MGWLSAVGSFLFGGTAKNEANQSNLMQAASGVGKWIDEQDFTEEEKVVARTRNTKMLIDGIVASQDENSTRSITRRVLAWMIMGSFITAFWIAVIQKLVFGVDPDDLLTIMDKFMLPELALAVGSFYFMVSLVRSRK